MKLFLFFFFLAGNLAAQNVLISEKSSMAVQFNDARTGRQLIIREGKHVKVFVKNERGELKYKKAMLTHIGKDSITFLPNNKKWKEISYCVDCDIHPSLPKLNKISFITGGSITGFVFFHVAVAGAVVGFFYELTTNPVVAAPVLLLLVISKPISEFGPSIPSRSSRKKTYLGSIRTHINSNPKKRWIIHIVDFGANAK